LAKEGASGELKEVGGLIEAVEAELGRVRSALASVGAS
jgi:hypothetical protein